MSDTTGWWLAFLIAGPIIVVGSLLWALLTPIGSAAEPQPRRPDPCRVGVVPLGAVPIRWVHVDTRTDVRVAGPFPSAHAASEALRLRGAPEHIAIEAWFVSPTKEQT